MARLTILPLLALLPLAPLHAQSEITEARIRAHIETLASDAYEGRLPGTRGEAMAVEYIARHMAQYGLAPAVGGESYYQPVALVERLPGEGRVSWQHDGERVAIAPGDVVLLGREPVEAIGEARMIFGGYGEDLDEEGGGRLGAMDLDGAVVFLFNALPPTQDAPSLADRRSRLAERGVAAVIGLTAPDDDWPAISAYARARGRNSLVSARMAGIEGLLSPQASALLLALGGLTPEAAPSVAAAHEFRPIELDYSFDARATTRLRPFTGYNVAGRIEGAADSDETVLVMAHHDHLGICAPESATDRICNGAVDNASGVAALLEVARVLARGDPPVRDILFVATTAEEMGLLGARALVEDPIVAIEDIVAAINLDTIAVAPAGASVAIIGRGMTPLDPVVDSVATALGRSINPSDEANAFIQRQDGWELTRAGVPSIMAGGSFSDMSLLGGFLGGAYHAAEDDLAHPIELGGATEDARLHVALVRAIADPARYANPRSGEGYGQ
ncbi:MAG: M20/M25/M40 family metallo-hydrolase [Sphingomonadaceae bacterium]|nr:M20/M25/M40 family metallo-hydrolase [Sphingomonadaceae bacterium]